MDGEISEKVENELEVEDEDEYQQRLNCWFSQNYGWSVCVRGRSTRLGISSPEFCVPTTPVLLTASYVVCAYQPCTQRDFGLGQSPRWRVQQLSDSLLGGRALICRFRGLKSLSYKSSSVSFFLQNIENRRQFTLVLNNGHPYKLPCCKYNAHKQSFLNRCLFGYMYRVALHWTVHSLYI